MKEEENKRIAIKCYTTINGELKVENIHFGLKVEKMLGWKK